MAERAAIFIPNGLGDVAYRRPIPALEGLIRRLSERFDVTVYSLLKADGVGEPMRCGRSLVKFVDAYATDSLPGRVYSLMKAFRKDHRQAPFSLVHGFWALPCGLTAVLVGKMFGVRSLVTLNGGEAACLPEISYGGMLRPISRRLILWTCRRADGLVAVSRFLADRLKERGLKRDDIEIIPYGAARESIGLAGKRPPAPPYRILHVADLNPVKDQMTLLEAFQRISRRLDCRLRVAGPDFLDGKLQHKAAELGIADRVSFLGYVPHDRLDEYYAWADILLHTSLYEGQPVVATEAAAHGVVVCGTRVGLIADWGERAAVCADVGDHALLAERIVDLLQSPERMAALRAEALAWAEAHDADWTAGQYEKQYLEFVKRGP